MEDDRVENIIKMLKIRITIERENVAAQVKKDTPGIMEALRYSIRADVLEQTVINIDEHYHETKELKERNDE